MDFMNSEEEVNLRRYKTDLTLGGGGYIIFGIWAVIKWIFMLTMNEYYFNNLIDEVNESGSDDIDRDIVIIVILIGLIIIFIAILAIHFWVGIMALKYSKGKSVGKKIIMVSSIVLLFNVLGLAAYPTELLDGTGSINLTALMSFIVDLSVTYLMFNVLYSAIMVRSLTRKIEIKEKEV